MPLDPLSDSDLSRTRRATATLRGAAIVALGFTQLVLFNLLQLSSLVLLPFSRSVFRRFNRWCANTWWGWCVGGAARFNHTHVTVTGDTVPDRENALVISNHQQMPDITVIMSFARSKQRLGDLKFFVKKQLKWTPGVGWGMQFLDCLFVDRSWAADEQKIRATFARLVDDDVPMWLVSFVEGTRATRKKLAAGQAFARSRGLDETQHVLVPRSKGFTASVHGLGQHIAAVYDLTIGYERGVPTLWQYIKGFVRHVHLNVRRFAVDDLPGSEADLRAWLLERFQQKDHLLEHFYTHGTFLDALPAHPSRDPATERIASQPGVC